MDNTFKKISNRTWATGLVSGDKSMFTIPKILENIASHMQGEVVIDYSSKYSPWPTVHKSESTLTFKSDEAEAEFLMFYTAGTFDEIL